VALGVYGTTLLDELNRLANGGTYRAPGEMVGEALAARQWAVQRSVSTNLTDTVGVLNAIAGTTSSNRLDYSGVCNLIAGTSQLPAAQALRAYLNVSAKFNLVCDQATTFNFPVLRFNNDADST
jgi:hypothetical protein